MTAAGGVVRLVTLNEPNAEPARPHLTAIVHVPGAAVAGSRHAKLARSRTTATTFADDVPACRSVPVQRGTARETTTVARTVLPCAALAGLVRNTTSPWRAEAAPAARVHQGAGRRRPERRRIGRHDPRTISISSPIRARLSPRPASPDRRLQKRTFVTRPPAGPSQTRP